MDNEVLNLKNISFYKNKKLKEFNLRNLLFFFFILLFLIIIAFKIINANDL